MPKDIDLETNVVRFRTEAPKSALAHGFEVKAVEDNVHEVFLYGELGWDFTTKEVIEELQDYRGAENTIRFRGNTPGGDVTEGYAIGNWIRQIDAKTEFYVDGIAASMGSYIAACCDKVFMPKNSLQMIHRPWGWVRGTAEDMNARATVLSKMADAMLAVYKEKQARTLGDDVDGEDIKELMWAETYLDANECLALGLADEITDEIKMAACIREDIADRFSGSLPAELFVAQEDPAPAEDTMPAESGNDTVPAEGEADAAAQTDDAAVAADAPEDTPAETKDEGLSDAQITEIRAACQLFKMPEKADGFVQARASFDDVRKSLWNAYADANAQAPDTTTTPQTTQAPQSKSLADALAELRAHQFARKNPKN